MAGHIKIDRKILNWEWYSDVNMFHLFLYFLLKANWKEGKFKGYTIKRGQLVTGRLKISKDTGLSEMQIRTCLNKLKSTNEITSKVTNKFTVITICKYDFYQNQSDDSNQQSNQQPIQQVTNKYPTSNQQVTTIEEFNKEGKEEQIRKVDENSIIGKMKDVWLKYNPKYQIQDNNDLPSLLNIAYKIAKFKGWDKQDVVNGKLQETIISWDKIAKFIEGDDFYTKLELVMIEKKWAGLVQTMGAAQKGSSKKEKEVDILRKL